MLHHLSRATRQRATRRHSGFSLVEMIGVLAIIAILAVVIVPKVFSTIASSRVTNTVASIKSMKTAVTDFVGKFGTIPLTLNNNSRIDDLLFTAGLTEGRFLVKIGTQPGATLVNGATWARNATTGVWTPTGGNNQTAQSRLICITSNSNVPSTALGGNYRLHGTVDLPAGSRVVSAVIVNITPTEAQELSMRIDGDVGSQLNTTTADDRGQVVYAAPNAQGFTTAYVYIAHQ